MDKYHLPSSRYHTEEANHRRDMYLMVSMHSINYSAALLNIMLHIPLATKCLP